MYSTQILCHCDGTLVKQDRYFQIYEWKYLHSYIAVMNTYPKAGNVERQGTAAPIDVDIPRYAPSKQ